MENYDYEAPKNDRPVVVFRLPRHEEMKVNQTETAKQGRPIYVHQEFCEVRLPADRNRLGVYPAHAEWKKINGQTVTYAMRYNKEYQAFKQNISPSITGTPIEDLPFIGHTKRFELKALHIFTAEQLANLEGQPLKNLGFGGRDLVEQTKAYLDKASGSADITRISAENAALRQQIEDLKEFHRLQSTAVAPKEEGSSSRFELMADDEIKEFLTTATGARPRGNPSHATLVRMAEEVEANQ